MLEKKTVPIIPPLSFLKFFSCCSLQHKRPLLGGRTTGSATTSIVLRHPSAVNRNSPGAPIIARALRWMSARWWILLVWWVIMGGVLAQPTVTANPPNAPIRVQAKQALSWQELGASVYVFDHPLHVHQGDQSVHAQRGVIWLTSASAGGRRPHRLQLYAEDATLESKTAAGISRTRKPQYVSSFSSSDQVQLAFHKIANQPDKLPVHYQRALIAREPSPSGHVALAQFVSPGAAAPFSPGPVIEPPPIPFSRRIRISGRGGTRMQISWFPSPDGRQQMTVINSGVNILIEGDPALGPLDISADRLVIWTPNDGFALDDPETSIDSSQPYELYMEGNIVFRQADRVVFANSMYYDVQQQTGSLLDAELLTPIPEYEGLVRLKAAVLRQLDAQRFQANGAAITTSRLGVPSYWFQAGELTYEEIDQPLVDPITGAALIDPQTGQAITEKQRLAVSRNNSTFVGGFPIFYWPRFATDLTRPSTVINRIRIGNDNIFGTQLGVGVDMARLFGLAARWPNFEWNVVLDYLSNRGWGVGTNLEYEFGSFLGIQGPTRGFLDAWGIDDQGLDNLGRDRRALFPEKNPRGRILRQHRQRTLGGLQITSEAGIISDRNFLEQYYELEWDTWKDNIVGLELKKLIDNASWNFATDFRVNDFFTQTQWYPRLDHYQLGQSLLDDRWTWYGHSQIGYADLKTATEPLNPADAAKWNPLPWEGPPGSRRQGIRVGGRHELDRPIEWRGGKIVPYVLGEVMHWGEDIDGNDLTRLYGQAGVRASVPMWTVDPSIQSQLFNVNGLAHKVVFESDFFWADASQNLDQLPLYDQLDDDSQEHFRRRFIDEIFGGAPFVDDPLPIRFDERFYAVRTGMQSWVTAPSTEIAEDLIRWQLAARQRWQTKRGAPGAQRIIDWMTLDIEGTLFPKQNRDNFGQTLGLVNYDWRWHVGDRLTLMSDGFADTFGDGLRVLTLGGYISRPERGTLFAGFRSIEGPISSNVLIVSTRYRMSPKWIGTAASTVDFSSTGNIGQLFELTRVGESFLITISARIDEGRDNVGYRLCHRATFSGIRPRRPPLIP